MFIAREERNIFGSVYALIDLEMEHTGRLGGMWVSSENRKQGVGTALFDSVKHWARERNIDQIKLWVSENDKGARSFYSGLGFKESGVKDKTRTKIGVDLNEMICALQA